MDLLRHKKRNAELSVRIDTAVTTGSRELGRLKNRDSGKLDNRIYEIILSTCVER